MEDLAMGMIRFENGALLQIEFSWASNVAREKSFVELRGSKAGIDWSQSRMKIFTEAGGKLKTVRKQRKTASGGHDKNLAHFIDVITGIAKPDFVPDQGIDMIKILTAIYESAATGKEVLL